ncbi:MAG: NAD-dependent epimerase/dehydratase family protein [Kouleothrix sp.]
MIVGDLRQAELVWQACAGAGTVFQCASLIDWRPGNQPHLYDVNVLGNRAVLAACAAQGVPRLVYTSSIDVVFDGRPIRDGNETIAYPARHLDFYGRTKAQAERDVLAANGRGGLATCALRLAGVYGPYDQHRFPPIIAAVRAGRMLRLGDGRARFNHVYVENAAHAHLLAAARLAPGSPAAGACYFITDHPASNFSTSPTSCCTSWAWRCRAGRSPTAPPTRWRWRSSCWRGAAAARPHAHALCRGIDLCRLLLSPRQGRARLGYQPIVSAAEARARTSAWLRSHVAGLRPWLAHSQFLW